MLARSVIRLLSSSSAKIFSTLSVRTLHSNGFDTPPHVEFYPHFLGCVNNIEKKKSFSYYIAITKSETLQLLLEDSVRLKEVIGVNLGDIDGANRLFQKLGSNHLSKIIVSVHDLVALPQTVIEFLDKASLTKIFDTSNKMVLGIMWASRPYYDISESQYVSVMKPSYWLIKMLDKLGQEHVTKLIGNPEATAKILSRRSIAEETIHKFINKYLEPEQPKPEKSQDNNSVPQNRFKR